MGVDSAHVPFFIKVKGETTMIKVYGVYDLMEWDAVIPCKNGTRLHVHFTDGSASVNGTVPAKYRTDNPIVQELIESSDWFKRGRIKLVRTYNDKTKTTASTLNVATTPKVEKVEAPKETTEEVTTLKQVKVSDIEGAGRKYLMQTFNIPYNDLRSMSKISAQAKAHGIEFVVA